jgi:DNA mismatch endonuclease (patch repair protein)
MPKTRIDFWQEKFKKNIERDQNVQKELNQLGWRVLVIWGCEIADKEKLERKIEAELRQAK